MQNAFIESFNSRLHNECLNEHVFLSLAEARVTIEAWRDDYNHSRPHSSLSALTPSEFAQLKAQTLILPPAGENNNSTLLMNLRIGEQPTSGNPRCDACGLLFANCNCGRSSRSSTKARRRSWPAFPVNINKSCDGWSGGVPPPEFQIPIFSTSPTLMSSLRRS